MEDRDTIYVDASSTCEIGSESFPFDTVTEGHRAATEGDKIVVRWHPGVPGVLAEGHYPEILRLDKQVRIEAEGGLVRIGP